MAEEQQLTHGGYHQQQQQVSGETVVFASLAGLAIGGPLLAMMGFTFVATITLLLVSSPLLIIFSPLLFFACFVFAAALAGFAAAGAMSMVGLSTIRWIFRSPERRSGELIDGVGLTDKMIEFGEGGKEQGNE